MGTCAKVALAMSPQLGYSVKNLGGLHGLPTKETELKI